MSSIKAKPILSIAVALLCLGGSGASAQNSVPPATEFWPKLNLNFDLRPRTRLQVMVAKENGEEFGFSQLKTGATISQRMKRIVRRHTDNADEENDYNLVVGVGYEYLRTTQDGGVKHENRLLVETTPRHAPGLGLLITDRSRIEFRWVDSAYNFRYRNKLTVNRSFKAGKLNLTPYASGELFWDRNHHAWNENQYSFGVQFSRRKRLMVDLFYLRQNCTTCKQDPLNVFGVTLNLFFRQTEK
jgi:hypothetical protein